MGIMPKWPDYVRERAWDDGARLATAITERGLPLGALDELERLGFTAAELGLLVINPRTYRHRRARDEALSVDEADRAVRLARVCKHAVHVFGTLERAFSWLRTPNASLARSVPMALLQTETGARVVEEALIGIEHGIFA